MAKYTYLFIILGSIAFPFAFSFERRLAFHKNWKYLFPAIAIMATFFIVWDHYFTVNGVWWFSDERTQGIKIYDLPIEEWMFFIIIPYCCVFVYESLNYYFKEPPLEKYQARISWVLLIVFVVTALTHITQAYTFYTCFFASVYLGFIILKKTKFMGKFYLAYLVSKIPFLIVNGLLTSIPVVLYNDHENLGIRIYTIPLDDTIYSFLMLLMTISMMEFFRNKEQQKKSKLI
jgi:lycopene cyclase domain-containing protein